MKNLYLGVCSLFLAWPVFAQSFIKGSVTDSQSGTSIPGATVDISGLGSLAANESGEFNWPYTRKGTYAVHISAIGYQRLDTTIEAETGAVIALPLKRIGLFLQPIEVRALRAGEKAPFTKTNISKKEIEQNNLGQDLPFILNQTPSVVINSDAGNGVGYTGIHIRGVDATRINMTLNGIPYNDAESQSIYFVDLPDFASSVNSIQIQRGVGTSSNGAGAFGATINFATNEFNGNPYAEFNNSYGSFNTWKNTVKAGSGLIDGHFTIDARLSRISSDGFIDRATSDLKSFYLSTAWLNKSSSLRLNIISGSEKTYQAWNGIPGAKLSGDRAALDEHYNNNIGSLYFTPGDSLNLYNSNNRTYNYFTYKNQTDNYQQDHYQLFFNHEYNSHSSFNAAGFMSHGKGYYEEYKPGQTYTDYGIQPPAIGSDTLFTTDLVRQRWLDNYFYGGIFSFQYKKEKTQLTAGGGWDRYDGSHYGNITWTQNGGVPPGYQYYSDPAHKSDFNIYTKWQQSFSPHWTGFADLQYRRVHYTLNGFDDNPELYIDKTYNFFNPKLGITFSNHDWQAYFSYSKSSHEPNRDDFEASKTQQPEPETLHDFEMGFEKKGPGWSWGATGYYMLYHNQLVLTGKINDIGEYTRTNIPESYRLGIELQAKTNITDWLNINANLALSQNKVLNYTEFIDDYDNGGQKSVFYKNTNIAFSPAVVSGITLDIFPVRPLQVSLLGKYVSKQYLDNSQKEDRVLNSYYVQDLRVIYTVPAKIFRETSLVFQLNNVFDKKYEPNGYTYSYFYGGQLVTENFFFPMAGTNFMLALNIKL